MSSAVPPTRARWIDAAFLLGRAGIVLTVVVTVLSFFGRYWFWAEICTHFLNLYAVAGAAGAVLCAPARRWSWVLVSLGILAVNAARIAPLYPPAAHAAAGSVRLTVVTANVLAANNRTRDVLTYLRDADADVLFLQEINAAWLDQFRTGLPEYRYAVSQVREDHFGIAVLSRIPLVDAEVVNLADHYIPAIVGAIEVSGTHVRFVNLHAMPPGSPYGLRLRNDQMFEAADLVAGAGEPGFVMGDFNCSPWSPYFRDLLHKYALRDARSGHGVLGTWPAFSWPFTIPIDQCLTTASIHAVAFERGPDIGSDHFPLRLELAISGG